MEDLIDFDEPHQLKLQYPMLWALHKALGVIRRDCIAIRIQDSSSETLKPGNLIQIIPEYTDGCHFRIWNYKDKQKTIYKCSNDDYIMVNMKLWPYLFALENDEGRVKFVENVNNEEFDMNVLNLGREIRIRARPGSEIQFYVFVVTHIGVVKDYGTGYYIGLQLQNDLFSWTTDLEYLSHYYRFGGTGIVVTADWIMRNLYKEIQNDDWIRLNLFEEQESEDTPITLQQEDSFHFDNHPNFEIGVEALDICDGICEPSPPIEVRKKTKETGIPNTHHHSPEIQLDVFCTKPNNISPNETNFEIIENIFENGNFGTGNAKTSMSCAKCHKSNIPEKGRFTLQNCGHTFCEDCSISTKASGSQQAQCSICGKKLDISELSKKIGLEALNALNKRNRKPRGQS